MCSRQLFSECYHKRFNVGSVFSMVKGRFEDPMRSNSGGGRPDEARAKVLCHRGWVPMRAAHDPDIEPPARAGSGNGPKLPSWRAGELFGEETSPKLDDFTDIYVKYT